MAPDLGRIKYLPISFQIQKFFWSKSELLITNYKQIKQTYFKRLTNNIILVIFYRWTYE